MERQAPGGAVSSTSGENIVAALQGQVRVLLPMPVGDGYDYAVPEELQISAGDFVAHHRAPDDDCAVHRTRTADPADRPAIGPALGRFGLP